jgi:alginate biosynthesis protein AlgX
MGKSENKRPALILAALLALLFAPAGSALAGTYGPYAGPEEYGWATYFKYHPAKRHLNPYPFPGPVIKAGQDIPVCPEARLPEAYIYKKEVKYIFHGKGGWLFRTADFRTDFKATSGTIDYFRRLNRALADKGQTLVVALQPPRALLEQAHLDQASLPKGYDPAAARKGYEDFLAQLHDAGIVTVDLADVPPGVEYFPRGDFHWSPEGAALAARQIADTVKKLPGYSDLRKQDFASRITGPAKIPTRGAYENFIQSACKINIEMSAKPLWATEAVGGGSSGLLDDTAAPGVTVIGTSNSAEDDKFNFIGSLKHFLRTDVYNAAIVAGGFGSSPYRYFSSDEYKSAPPKFVVWEFLPQHQYNSGESALSFRQMIPAVYGACNENEAMATYSRDIASAETSVFSEAKNKPLGNSYLYMEVTNPVERNLKVNVLYGDGNADQVDLTRSTRAENNGKYYLDLSKTSSQPMVFFNLITDRPQGHINARLCHYPVHFASR